MIKDRRKEGRYIHVNFEAKENFDVYPGTDYLTLTLITDGSWNVTANGTEYSLKAPFILCLNKYDSFILHENQKAAAKTFSFAPTFLNSSLTYEALQSNTYTALEDQHDRNLLYPFLKRNTNYKGLIQLNAATAMQINTWLSIIGSECFSQSDGKWTCRIRRYLLQILYLLEDEYLILYEKQLSIKQPVDYALEYIHTNYHLGLTLDGISTYVGLNRTSLNKHCKQKTGMTIIQYLNHYRMQMAKEALCHTNLNLNEIALCCGYNYESYFIKTFTESQGLSPTEFRQKIYE